MTEFSRFFESVLTEDTKSVSYVEDEDGVTINGLFLEEYGGERLFDCWVWFCERMESMTNLEIFYYHTKFMGETDLKYLRRPANLVKVILPHLDDCPSEFLEGVEDLMVDWLVVTPEKMYAPKDSLKKFEICNVEFFFKETRSKSRTGRGISTVYKIVYTDGTEDTFSKEDYKLHQLKNEMIEQQFIKQFEDVELIYDKE